MGTPPSKAEAELAALLSEWGLTFVTDANIPFGTKSDGKARFCAPDIVVREQRVVAFYDGCYWHRCADHGPDDAKAAEIRDKDATITAGLTAAGWLVIRVWEHDDLDKSARRIVEAVFERHASMKAIHRLGTPCMHRPRTAWCDYCCEDAHVIVPDETGADCRRCGVSARAHEAAAMRAIIEQADALAYDLRLISLRNADDHHVRPAEMREIGAVAARIGRQVALLPTDTGIEG
jgi:DNA mismatch endonuclease (patch repair protein)